MNTLAMVTIYYALTASYLMYIVKYHGGECHRPKSHVIIPWPISDRGASCSAITICAMATVITVLSLCQFTYYDY